MAGRNSIAKADAREREAASAAGMPAMDGRDQDPRAIRSMFGQIAPTYDRLNHLLSGQMDRRWRAAAAAALTAGLEPRGAVLDVATGTGDLAVAVRGRLGGGRVTGLDFTGPMVREARRKYGGDRLSWLQGDGLRLPFRDGTFDACCIAFGLRNMADRPAGLAEMARVTRPGGRVGVLEFSEPRGRVFGPVCRFYTRRVMPRIGQWISRSEAYGYLNRSIEAFWGPEALREAMQEAGLRDVEMKAMTMGTVYWHMGIVCGGRDCGQDKDYERARGGL